MSETKTATVMQTTRFDRHLALNIHDFVTFKQYSNIIKDLCVYIAYRYNNTKDLFENGKLDPYEFAGLFGYSREDLFRSITEKDTFDGFIPHTTVNGKKYKLDTILEYSLHLMGKINLHMSIGVKESATNDINMSYSYIQILKKFDVTISDKFGEKKGKRVYFFKPSEDFINNLARCFIDVNINLIPLFRKRNLFDLYFYLLSMQNILVYKKLKGVEENGQPQFDFLCELAEVNNAEVKYKKKYLTQKITKVIEEGKLLMSFEWTGTGKYKYTPVFTLIDMPTAIEENSSINRLENVYKRNAEDFFISQKLKGDFVDWFANKTKDIDSKIPLYIQAYKLVYGQTLTKTDKYVRRYFNL